MLAEFIFVLILTLILVGLLVPVGRYRSHHYRSYRRRTGEEAEEERSAAGVGVGLTMVFFFFLLFPMILAGSFWVGPHGPMFMGVSWAPIVVIGILLALFIAAVSPREPDPARTGTTTPEEPVAAGLFGLFGLIYFIFLIAIIAVIVAAIV